MKDYYDSKNHSCKKKDSYIKNKKTIYCKNCKQQIFGVCRYLFDEKY